MTKPIDMESAPAGTKRKAHDYVMQAIARAAEDGHLTVVELLSSIARSLELTPAEMFREVRLDTGLFNEIPFKKVET